MLVEPFEVEVTKWQAGASVFGLPLLKLDAGKLFGGLVGQSEGMGSQNHSKAIGLARRGICLAMGAVASRGLLKNFSLALGCAGAFMLRPVAGGKFLMLFPRAPRIEDLVNSPKSTETAKPAPPSGCYPLATAHGIA